MTNIATNLIDAITATFRADAQDLLETVKALWRMYDDMPEDINAAIALEETVYRAMDIIHRDVQDRISHEDDEASLDPTYPRDPVLHDVLACIKEFYN